VHRLVADLDVTNSVIKKTTPKIFAFLIIEMQCIISWTRESKVTLRYEKKEANQYLED
jgi:hypothetical protein